MLGVCRRLWQGPEHLDPGGHMADGFDMRQAVAGVLTRPLPFVRWERLGTPAETAARPRHAQPGLGTFLNQLALKLG